MSPIVHHGIGPGLWEREQEEGANVCTCTYIFWALLHEVVFYDEI